MNPSKNDRILRVLRREPVDRTPIWLMRQAGRYLPEYKALRQQAGSFLNLCKNPELACTVTLQPLARFPLDAAILFSDILTIPDAMGLGLYFNEGEGPAFTQVIRSARDVKALPIPDPTHELRYVLDTIQLIQRELAGKVPLIGFCGSPWTVATYMVEGRANKTFPAIQALSRREPEVLKQLLSKLAQAISLHLKAQISAGVQIVMLFDTWGSLLNTDDYRTFSLFYMQQIIAELKQMPLAQQVPVILFTKGGGQWLNLMAETGCDALGIDWQVNLHAARAAVGRQVTLQGNLNPAILYESPETIQMEVARILAEFGAGSGHIFNLGHGIPKEVNPEHVAVLVDAVHQQSQRYHENNL